jgi:hypothetical protein
VGAQRAVITGPAAWRGPQIQDDPAWIVHFDAQDLAGIDAALSQAKRVGAKVPFGPAEFPLPQLAAKLDAVLEEIENGRGFVLLRGIPRHRYSDEDCERIYWGLGIRFGNPVSQNARGHRLGHVRDEGRIYADPDARGYQTSQRMDFHADSLPVDVLGLFCLRTAKAGGASKLVSALTVHNVLREERPDLLEVLYSPFFVDWRGEEPDGEAPWFQNPLFSERGGRVSTRICSRPYFESAARYGERYRPTAVQLEALDYVQEICNRPELMLTMDFQEGDIQLINNHVLLHAREAFEDHTEPGRERHLLRMWIAVDDTRRRPLAEALSGRYRWVREGGIPVKGQPIPSA